MVQPATKYARITNELSDPSQYLSEFRLHEMLRDLRQAHRAGAVPEHVAEHLEGLIRMRLGGVGQALPHLLRAAKLHPDWLNLHNAGCAFIIAGQEGEAVEFLTRSAECEGGYNHLVFGNLAVALANLGLAEDGDRVFAEALRLAPPDDPVASLQLADSASGRGSYAQAVDLFARFLAGRAGVARGDVPPLRFIDEAPEGWWEGLAVPASIEKAVSRVRMLDEPPALPDERDLQGDLCEGVLAMFEETRESRRRANESALSAARRGDG